MNSLPRCKTKASLLLALMAISTYSGLSLAQDTDVTAPTERMTYRDNYVYLQVKSGDYKLLSGTYETKDRSITSGQDPNGKNDPPHSYDVRGHDGAIGFSVGRKGSSSVADWFNRLAGGNRNTYGKSPDSLNFAFTGDLKLSIQGPGLNPNEPVVLPDIVLAQGKKMAANLWWFGGPNCTNVGNANVDKATCRSSNYPSMKFTFVRGQVDFWNNNASDEVYVYIEKDR
ncbi:MAG TPA: hypothetical protein VIM98_09750 [Dyella sp.]|uniref:hypothetical protein n=1 Tax=Dyella sp. TaxID=1869338 RepID=UPI002F93758C